MYEGLSFTPNDIDGLSKTRRRRALNFLLFLELKISNVFFRLEGMVMVLQGRMIRHVSATS
ncbi:hypothetical protein HanIR_Chr15g0730621 [Helianthus annuus]|nr:hypothetical protein HanIR_Chr15g0730621 [Helianthus annuus]